MSRDRILSAIRNHLPPMVDLPPAEGLGVDYPDRLAQFLSMVDHVGGRAITVPTVDAVADHLGDVPGGDGEVLCTVPGLERLTTIDVAAVRQPTDWAGLDLTILPGSIAVAETAAVWVTDAHMPHRAVHVLAQHLALVIEAQAIVADMHAAYAAVGEPDADYGLFLSGPSKTGDIEQALVIGAHGPRSSTVFVVGGEGEAVRLKAVRLLGPSAPRRLQGLTAFSLIA